MKRLKYLPNTAVLLALQTARKARWCEAEPSPSGCHRHIQPGEQYATATLTPRHDVMPGWWRQSFCLPCAEWWGWLDALSVDERRDLVS